eukprot:jgi/Psemu1/37033/gm1.37033_g
MNHRSLPTSTKRPLIPPEKMKRSFKQASEEREAKQKKAETKKAPMEGTRADNISVAAGDTDDAEVFRDNNEADSLIKLRRSISSRKTLSLKYASKDDKDSIQKVTNLLPSDDDRLLNPSYLSSDDDSDYETKHFTKQFSVQVQRYSLGKRGYYGDLKITYDGYTQSLSINGKPKMKVVQAENAEKQELEFVESVVIFEILLTDINRSKLKPPPAFQSNCIKTSLIVEFSCKSEVHLLKKKLRQDIAKPDRITKSVAGESRMLNGFKEPELAQYQTYEDKIVRR